MPGSPVSRLVTTTGAPKVAAWAAPASPPRARTETTTLPATARRNPSGDPIATSAKSTRAPTGPHRGERYPIRVRSARREVAVVEQVLQARGPVVLDDRHRAGPIGAGAGAAPGEPGRVHPASGVPQPRALRHPPAPLVLAGPAPVRVTEDQMVGVDPEAARDLDHRVEARARDRPRREARANRPEAEPVGDPHRAREGDGAQQPAPQLGGPPVAAAERLPDPRRRVGPAEALARAARLREREQERVDGRL